MITQERLKELLHYCPETGIFTWKIKRSNRIKVGDVAGGLNNMGYIRIRAGSSQQYAHRLAFLYVEGVMPEEPIDHINGNRSDNRLGNLRRVSNTDNQRNSSLSRRNKSGFTGVHWAKHVKKWEASIRINRRTIHLGLFNDIDGAIEARKEANIKYGFHENHGKPKLQTNTNSPKSI